LLAAVQGANKKILCLLSMLERRMAQGKDFKFFYFLLFTLPQTFSLSGAKAYIGFVIGLLVYMFQRFDGAIYQSS
jgi:hypothetical protein